MEYKVRLVLAENGIALSFLHRSIWERMRDKGLIQKKDNSWVYDMDRLDEIVDEVDELWINAQRYFKTKKQKNEDEITDDDIPF